MSVKHLSIFVTITQAAELAGLIAVSVDVYDIPRSVMQVARLDSALACIASVRVAAIFGMATAAKMPNMTITKTSSIMVNPDLSFCIAISFTVCLCSRNISERIFTLFDYKLR